jgi:hypothetical protein
MTFLEEKPSPSGSRLVSESAQAKCPKCDATLGNWRTSAPNIDECGFESYNLACYECKARLAGIVDPGDGCLLLTNLEVSDHCSKSISSVKIRDIAPNDLRPHHSAAAASLQLAARQLTEQPGNGLLRPSAAQVGQRTWRRGDDQSGKVAAAYHLFQRGRHAFDKAVLAAKRLCGAGGRREKNLSQTQSTTNSSAACGIPSIQQLAQSAPGRTDLA